MTVTDNRFAVPLESLDAEAAATAAGSLLVASTTFASFEDHPESHYYSADGMTPAETWDALTAEVGRVAAIAAVEAFNGGELEVNDLHQIHRAIFEPVFGASTLGQRRNDEQVEFGIVQGPRDSPEEKVVRGIGARALPYRLKSLCKELSEAVDESDRIIERREETRLIDSIRPAARAYCQFLAWHPYFDGNGRTAFPILTFALIRMGLVAVAVPESQDFHWCLGRGMRRSQREFDSFAGHLEAIIKGSLAT